MTMTRRCLLLFTGGLDTLLAARLLLEQGIEVRALHVANVLTCGGCQAQGVQAAAEGLGIACDVVPVPVHGVDWLRTAWPEVAHGPNPCVRCRADMLRAAQSRLRDDHDWVATGEVVGQRPGQSRKDLASAAHRAGLDGRVLRPLSALLLPPTLMEQQGTVDRSQLLELSGRGRKGQIELARKLGLEAPAPSPGCPLDRAEMSTRVGELLRQTPPATVEVFELLTLGRHVLVAPDVRVVLGRSAEENDAIAGWFRRASQAAGCAAKLLTPEGFSGPTALVLGGDTMEESGTPDVAELAAGLMHRFARPTTEERWAREFTQGNEAGRLVRVAAEKSAPSVEPGQNRVE